MTTIDNSQFQFSFKTLITTLVKYRKLYLKLIGVTLLLAIIISLIIKNKYKAEVIVFPTSTNSISKSLMSDVTDRKQDLLQFGEDEDVDQLIQILESDELKDKLVKRFDLFTHYDIDIDSKTKNSEMGLLLRANILFKRTEYTSVKIIVTDNDPELAAKMANEITFLYDTIKHNIQRQRAEQAYLMVLNQYNDATGEIKIEEDSLRKLREMGINDYESQSERLNEAYGKAIIDGRDGAALKLNEKLKILSTFGGYYVTLRDDIYFKRKELARIKTKLDEAHMDVVQNVPSKFVVSAARVPEKKYYPVRWLIVLISLVSATILFALGICVYELRFELINYVGLDKLHFDENK
jgi:uncharacterized protein involved in exopolysaccharide biosynthesis